MRSIFSWRAAAAALGLLGLVMTGLAQTTPTPTYTADGSNLSGHATGPVLDLRVSPDGMYAASVVAVAANPGGAEVRVRNAQTGEFLWTANVGLLPEAGLPRLAFTPDSSRLYFVQADAAGTETVIAAKPSDGSVLSSFSDGDNGFYRSRVAINAAGTVYAYQAGDNRTGSTRRRIVLRQVSNNALVQSIVIGGSGISANIRDFCFTPSGTELVIALASGNVYRKLQVAPETEVSLGVAGSSINRIELFGSSSDLLFATTSSLDRRAVSNGALVRNYSNVPAGGVNSIALFGSLASGEAVTAGAVGAFNFATFVKLDDGASIAQFDLHRDGEAASDSMMNAIGSTGGSDKGIVFGSAGAASPAARVIRVDQPGPYTLTIPDSVLGGENTTGSIALPAAAPAGGMTITLGGSGVTVPASVTVAAGETTASFDITTINEDADTPATVTAYFPFGPSAQTITVKKIEISSLTLARHTIGNTQSVTGTVTLNIAPTTDRSVTLSQSPTAGTLPAAVTVLGGSSTATFTFSPNVTSTDAPVTIEGSINGTSASDSLTVLGTLLRGVEVYPYSARPGQRITGIVRLAKPAVEETQVAITSNYNSLLGAQNVTIPAGASYGRFTATLGTGNTARAIVSLSSSYTSSAGDSEARSDKFYVTIPANCTASGQGTSGQLGDGVTVNQPVTLRAARLNADTVKACGGDTFSVYLMSDGTVRESGTGVQGEIGNGASGAGAVYVLPTLLPITGVVDVAAGNNFVVAIDNVGRHRAWGRNAEGQLGDGTTVQRNSAIVGPSLGLVKVACGQTHTVALNANGDAYVWGTGTEGQLGLGATTQALVPTHVMGGIVDIAAGRHHTLLLAADGTVYAFGRNSEGQLGLGDTTNRDVPTPIAGLTEIRSVRAGGFHSLLLKVPAFGANASIYSFGLASSGQLGVAATPAYRTSPTLVTTGTWLDMAAGDKHSVIVSIGGTVDTFGGNAYGQISNGTYTDRISLFTATGHSPAGTIGAGTNTTFSTRLTVVQPKNKAVYADTAARTISMFDWSTSATSTVSGTYPENLTPFAAGSTATAPRNVFFYDNTTNQLYVSVVTNGFALQTPAAKNVTFASGDVPVAIADFNVDGLPDFVTVNSTTHEVKTYIWDGSSLTSTATLYTLDGETLAAAEDFDGDNRTDLVIRKDSTRVLRVVRFSGTTYLNDVPFTLTTGSIAGGHLANLRIVGTGEVNAARMQELVFVNTDTGNFQLWDLSRTVVYTNHIQYAPAPTTTFLSFWN